MLPALLLNELQKQKVAADAERELLRREIAALTARLARLETVAPR